ncbi:MAG TPA: KH domain-containing protein [Solirubrobacteraceae bacterium]|nr:KH domain-containing protein [Solirubrobacteraceae bacterium]
MSNDTSSPRELLEYLARGLVDDPDRVKVNEVREDDGSVVLELSVAQDDYGSVIGRGGRTASALRTVVKSAAVKYGHRVFVDIVD